MAIFRNLDNIDKNKVTVKKLFHYFRIRNQGKDLTKKIPVSNHLQIDYLKENRTQITYTWIGHSTFLIQMSGLNILTDPVFSNRMGLEKRLVPPGIFLKDLPPIDIVLISHAHFDHLEFQSLRKLKGNPHIYVPYGLKRLFKQKGFASIIEANWWDHFTHEDLSIHFVPAQHWSRRNLLDKNRAHWGGWVFLSTDHTFYFVGDTGYFRGFQEIGTRFSIDTIFAPIGDYEPEWMSGLQHMNPEQAIQAFVDVAAESFVPMHYGTYRLSMDTGPEALDRLRAEWNRRKLSENKINILKIGETVILPQSNH
ncbi:MBL fold metallo-hydrolase [Alkalihalobacillus sp. MEB130]|uniref:MBL fold metallo-hydrolase n=1 Tax=Alkalihalobacillus sp. MEB130 TaxID=2976704 RepID=UPI0028E0641D|nr:MBL fold metallo-hydrolase [Alkalihalobacillus sp. MEB130]MDT8861636.1 MBL fold metallo-hydrolase [Alkalihalobacillus sp. MEB130]